jgi:hypothetical protein
VKAPICSHLGWLALVPASCSWCVCVDHRPAQLASRGAALLWPCAVGLAFLLALSWNYITFYRSHCGASTGVNVARNDLFLRGKPLSRSAEVGRIKTLLAAGAGHGAQRAAVAVHSTAVQDVLGDGGNPALHLAALWHGASPPAVAGESAGQSSDKSYGGQCTRPVQSDLPLHDLLSPACINMSTIVSCLFLHCIRFLRNHLLAHPS